MPVTPLCDSNDVLLCDTHDYCFVNKSQFNFHTQFVFIRLRVLYTLPIYFCAATMSSLKLKEKQHLSSNNYDEWCVAMLVLFDTINGRKYVTSLHEDLTPEQQIVSAQVAATIYCNVDAENKKVLAPSIASQEACNPHILWNLLQKKHNPPTTSNHHNLKAGFYSTQLDDTESTDQFLTHLKASADKANAITEKHLRQMCEAQAQELQFAFPPPSLLSKSSSSSGLGSTTGSDFTLHSSLGSTAFKSKKKITQEDIKEILIDILVNHLDLAKPILEMFGFVGTGLIVEDDMLLVLLTSIHHCYEAVYNYLVGQSHLTFPKAQNHVMEHASDTFESNNQLFANQSSHRKRRKRQKGLAPVV